MSYYTKAHILRQVLLATAVISVASLAPAVQASPAIPAMPVDKRIKLLEYYEADIYKIVTRVGYQTNIIFGKGETIQTISVGERSVWQIIPSKHRLFIRPLIDNASTNMTVITNQHTYFFDLKSVGDGSKDDVVYVMQFVYPPPKPLPQEENFHPAPVTSHAAVDAALPLPAAKIVIGNNRNYDYSFSGPDALAPAQVFDDGVRTYVRYADITRPLPTPFLVDSFGKVVPTGYVMQDGTMVLDQVAAEWALKSQDGTIHIYNETISSR